MNEKWFLLSTAEIENKLKTNAASGMSRKAARSAWNFHYQRAGALFVKSKKSSGKMLSEIFSDFALVLLLSAAILCLFFEENYIGVSVLAISVFSVAVSLLYYFKAQRSLENMQTHFMPTAKVIRGGKLYCVSCNELVPGDVIIVEKGDVVCADARLVTSDALKVSMRVEKNKYISLDKQSNGTLPTDGNDPTKLTNILHAGSIVESGSARAIVYAIGRYTYLGAKTGGIFEQKPDVTPKALADMKRICSLVSFISMLCILPFCIISLVIGKINGGTSVLSSVFITALAITASSLTQLASTLCKLFYARASKSLLSARNPVAIRTAQTLDKLFGIKHIFMLDGCALTDGVLHFDAAFNAEGEIKKINTYTPSISMLFEAVTLYNTADVKSLSVGISLPNRFKTGLAEFLSQSNTDVDALNIRCPIVSYSTATITDPVDRVYYTDMGTGYVIEVSQGTQLLTMATHGIFGASIQTLSGLGADRLRHAAQMYTSSGKKVLVFTRCRVSSSGAIGERCFIGAVVLSERTDLSAVKSIQELKKTRGVNVISFIPSSTSSAILDVPSDARLGVSAQKADFIRDAKPVTYKFGEIGTYYGLNDFDISELIEYAHSRDEAVAVVAFSNTYKSALNAADVFISCSDIDTNLGLRSQQHLEKTETWGEATSMSCVQKVRSQADMLIRRPSAKKRGGLSALLNAFAAVTTIRKNLAAFFTYVMTTQLLRVCMVAIPMIFGDTILDARHVALCGFIIDMSVLIMFAFDKRSLFAHNCSDTFTLKKYISSNKPLWIATIISTLFAIACPWVVAYVGFMGDYLYETEYMFCALLWMHLAILFYVRFGGIKNIDKAVTDKPFLIFTAGLIAFVALLHIVSPLGILMNMVWNPVSYFVLALVPMAIFGITVTIASITKKK